MRIAILGTRGIPNNYGGFEQFAQYISEGLVKRGHDLTVYAPVSHPYTLGEFNGVKIIRIYSPERSLGPMANFLYDHLCLQDALKRNFDIIYEAGYATVAFSYLILKAKLARSILVTNMDGIEWKRSKWNFATRKFILFLEGISLKHSHYLISDNIEIKRFYAEKYHKETEFIAYGAEVIENISPLPLQNYKVTEREFYLLIARLEPENNIELILDGFILSGSALPFIVVGNAATKYGKHLQAKYSGKNIQFIGGVYNKEDLDALRVYCKIYFHGHSVGGTNPSLLEAMAVGALIAAHGNGFNRTVLAESGLYFETAQEIAALISNSGLKAGTYFDSLRHQGMEIIRSEYNWELIIDRYEQYFEAICLKEHTKKGH